MMERWFLYSATDTNPDILPMMDVLCCTITDYEWKLDGSGLTDKTFYVEIVRLGLFRLVLNTSFSYQGASDAF